MTTASAILSSPGIIVAAHELTAQTELIRGTEKPLLERVIPLLGRQSVSLDFSAVRRIDAAGIAALVRLYRVARDAGNCFTLLNVAPRIQQILSVVGLDRILLDRQEARSARGRGQFGCSAA